MRHVRTKNAVTHVRELAESVPNVLLSITTLFVAVRLVLLVILSVDANQ